MNLYKVTYREWNSSFSDMYDCEELSVGETKKDAIERVKEIAGKDARDFDAEKISHVFGRKIVLENEQEQVLNAEEANSMPITAEETVAEQSGNENYAEVKSQFLQRITENYAEAISKNPSENARNMYLFIFEYIKCYIHEATDKDIQVLMQFKNPFRVIMESQPVENAQFEKRISETAQSLMNRDIMTLPFELDQNNILMETRYRHNAINSITNMVLYPDFNTTMKWLELCRDISDGETNTNPYKSLVDAFNQVSMKQGYNTLQQLYYMGRENVILPKEVIEAGKYLADGGSINNVPILAKHGYFECPYADNHPADEFLALRGEEQGGMRMS